MTLGGSNPIDELDSLCKRWIKDRRCAKLEGGSCHGEFKERYYSIEAGDFDGNTEESDI